MTPEANAIQHEEKDGRGVFFVMRDGERVARMTYRREGDRLVEILHTEVSPELRGQGTGRALLDAAIAWARATGTRFNVSCPFARAQFTRDPSIRDVLA